jgi:hypothetical protein
MPCNWLVIQNVGQFYLLGLASEHVRLEFYCSLFMALFSQAIS